MGHFSSSTGIRSKAIIGMQSNAWHIKEAILLDDWALFILGFTIKWVSVKSPCKACVFASLGSAPICQGCIYVSFHMAHMTHKHTALHCLKSSIVHIMYDLTVWLVLLSDMTVNDWLMLSRSRLAERPRRGDLNCWRLVVEHYGWFLEKIPPEKEHMSPFAITLK